MPHTGLISDTGHAGLWPVDLGNDLQLQVIKKIMFIDSLTYICFQGGLMINKRTEILKVCVFEYFFIQSKIINKK